MNNKIPTYNMSNKNNIIITIITSMNSILFSYLKYDNLEAKGVDHESKKNNNSQSEGRSR